MKQSDFEQKVIETVQQGMLRTLAKADFVSIPYDSRPRLDVADLRRAYAAIDMNRVIQQVTAKMEQGLADRIYNQMATEFGNDCKGLLCNKDLREQFRAVMVKVIARAEGVSR